MNAVAVAITILRVAFSIYTKLTTKRPAMIPPQAASKVTAHFFENLYVYTAVYPPNSAHKIITLITIYPEVAIGKKKL